MESDQYNFFDLKREVDSDQNKQKLIQFLVPLSYHGTVLKKNRTKNLYFGKFQEYQRSNILVVLLFISQVSNSNDYHTVCFEFRITLRDVWFMICFENIYIKYTKHHYEKILWTMHPFRNGWDMTKIAKLLLATSVLGEYDVVR